MHALVSIATRRARMRQRMLAGFAWHCARFLDMHALRIEIILGLVSTEVVECNSLYIAIAIVQGGS